MRKREDVRQSLRARRYHRCQCSGGRLRWITVPTRATPQKWRVARALVNLTPGILRRNSIEKSESSAVMYLPNEFDFLPPRECVAPGSLCS